MNALAAIAIASDEGIADEAIIQGLSEFAGVDRRFEMTPKIAIGESAVTLVDDYGHHPTEVEVVIATARQVWPERRLVMGVSHDILEQKICLMTLCVCCLWSMRCYCWMSIPLARCQLIAPTVDR